MMLKNYDQSVKINHNPNPVKINHKSNHKSYILDHTYRIIDIDSLWSDKTNVFLNLIKTNNQILTKFIHMSKIYSYQWLINRREKIGVKKFQNPKAFIDYSQNIDDVYENLEFYDLPKKRKVLIVFDDMITDMEANEKLNTTGTELFLRGRKLNISLVFILKSYFEVPKTIRLNATHYFIMNFTIYYQIPNKRELHQIASNHSSDIDFKDFMKF